MDPTSMLGPLDLLYPVIEEVLLVLVLANFATRFLAYRSLEQQYDDGGPEAMQRHPAHLVSNLLLVAATFYFVTVNYFHGVVLSVFVLGVILTDFFEFEARLVEARKEEPLEKPKSAIAAAGLTLLYVSYLTLFFVVEPLWNGIVA